jgi:hypothetical protein
VRFDERNCKLQGDAKLVRFYINVLEATVTVNLQVLYDTQTAPTVRRLIVKAVGGNKGQKSTDRAKQQATNRPQHVDPRACRSALRLRAADLNCSREKSCKI